MKRLSLAVVGVIALAACSSDPEPVATVSASPTPTITVTPEVTIEEGVVLIDGCGAYFEFDLIRSTVLAGTDDLTRKQKRDLLAEYRGAADTMVEDVEVSVTAGDLPENALTNAQRISTNLEKATTKQGTDGISAAQATRIDKSAQRIEAMCEAEGDLLPQENLDARTGTG